VATEKFATFWPDGSVRITGLEPRLPISITLLRAIVLTSIWFVRPLPVIGQGVLRFAFITAQLFRGDLSPKSGGRCADSRCASKAEQA
jgi:hypothetical protein